MKKLYSALILFAMMVVTVGLVSCSGSDDEDEGGSGSGKKTLIVDGTAYYSYPSYIEDLPVRDYMVFIIYWSDNQYIPNVNQYLELSYNGVSSISELHEGDVLDDHLQVVVYAMPKIYCEWDFDDGSITIVKITSENLTVKFNNLTIKNSSSGKTHTFNGTITLPIHRG